VIEWLKRIEAEEGGDGIDGIESDERGMMVLHGPSPHGLRRIG
jgi:hypothetical protein